MALKMLMIVTYSEHDGGIELGHIEGSSAVIDFVENSVDNAWIGSSYGAKLSLLYAKLDDFRKCLVLQVFC